jgi:predicted metal-dependent hydrolase
MNTEKTKTIICDLEIETVKKDIKNIHVGVYPPNGRVRVAAPLKTTDEAIKLLVISKMPGSRNNNSSLTNKSAKPNANTSLVRATTF